MQNNRIHKTENEIQTNNTKTHNIQNRKQNTKNKITHKTIQNTEYTK